LIGKITEIKAREILDSRGNPTIEVDVFSDKVKATAKVPSGASTGAHEACELRDGGKRYGGKGVKKAVKNVNTTIKKHLIGKAVNPTKVDLELIKLDGTENKSNLGANAILGVSMAVVRLSAKLENKPLYKKIKELAGTKGKKYVLPTGYFNIINGGEHADNDLEFQEFMIAPKARTFAEKLRIAAEVYHTLKGLLKKKYGMSSTSVGDEGGFAPQMKKVKEPLEIIMKAVTKAGYKGKVDIAIDAAASEFYTKGKGYFVDGKYLTPEKLLDLYAELVKKYPITSIEDPFSEDNWDEFKMMTKRLGKKIQVVGDDHLVTNPIRIKRSIVEKSCNALLLKVNQIGTVTESIEAANLAMKNGWKIMVSHRSGETSDNFIADLVVGLGCGEIKSGAPCRSERLSKYNRLLVIEEETLKKK
jgi:enolase